MIWENVKLLVNGKEVNCVPLQYETKVRPSWKFSELRLVLKHIPNKDSARKAIRNGAVEVLYGSNKFPVAIAFLS